MTASADPRKGARIAKLANLMDRLLSEDGCPWDRSQTLDSLRPYLLEETYEVLEALDGGVAEDHREELGDLLFQIVFQAALREREGAFGLDDVADGIIEKLVRRHPHVFDSARGTAPGSPEEALRQWSAIKAEERAAKGTPERAASVLDGLPKALPALSLAQGLSDRASRVGFDWPDVRGSFDKVKEEVDEIEHELSVAGNVDPSRLEAEIGDLLFATCNLARKLGLDAETCARLASHRFQSRFSYIEEKLSELGKSPAESDLAEMDALWNAAKASGR